MKIAFFTNSYFPITYGSAISVDYFRRGLEELGHEVYVFAPKFHSVNNQKERRVFRYPSIMYGYKIEYPLPISRSKKMDQLLDELNIDLIHAHQPFALGKEALRQARKRNVPIVFTYHCKYEDYTHYIPFWQAFLKKYVVKRATNFANAVDRVIAPTEEIEKILKDRQIKTPIEVLPTGIDWERFQRGKRKETRKNMSIKEDEVCFLWVGRLEQEKNITFLMKLIKELSKQLNAKFLIVGDGSEWVVLEKFIRKNNLSERVRMTGLIPSGDIHHYYSAGDIFIQTSKSETQGLTILEAMATGMPVLAVEATGAIDIVIHGKTGYLLSEDVEFFVNKAKELVADRQKYQRFSDTAKTAAKNYDYREMAKKLAGVYEGIIKWE